MPMWSRTLITLMAMILFVGGSSAGSVGPDGTVEENDWQGHLACSYAVAGNTPHANTCSIPFDESDHTHYFIASQGLKTVSVAVVWDPETATLNPNEELRVRLVKTVPSPTAIYGTWVGTSPLEFRVDAGDSTSQSDFGNIGSQGWTLGFIVYAGGTPNLVLGQDFPVHYHLHYGTHAPDGYSALP